MTARKKAAARKPGQRVYMRKRYFIVSASTPEALAQVVDKWMGESGQAKRYATCGGPFVFDNYVYQALQESETPPKGESEDG